MTDIMKIKLLFIAGLFLSMVANAQELEDEDIDFLVNNSGSKISFTDYISGEYALIGATSGGVERSGSIFNMALNVPWDTDLTKGRFYTAVNRYDYRIKVTQVLIDSSQESEFLPLKKND